ncbi:hypothetical protein GGU10DRAFT_114922 [Lentinula aff. detonsa]|uniref:PHD-type domain-containing protein n=1 Tax=Lentinula aff. detonsa TaxID=2804958 RepID=A0AA38L6V2_9AGAR|nr:hypothetical protein GGU10DRAFT_114922 [Lentinula aff. detonsa]
MLSRACHRCRGTEHQPSKHLLTCQACHKTWHHSCHIPMVTESEMCARMKGTLRNVGSTIGEETPLSLENWLCRRCCKTQNLGNTKSHFNQPQSRLRDAATKLVREQDVVVISDSDSDDIQFVGLRPSSGALSQRVGQHPSPSVVKELESEKGVAQKEVMSIQSVPALLPSSTKSIPVNDDGHGSGPSVSSSKSHKTIVPTAFASHTLLLPRLDPQSHIMKYEVIEPVLNRTIQHIDGQPIEVPPTEFAGLKIAREAVSSEHPTLSVLSPASRSPTGSRTLSDIVFDLRNHNSSFLPAEGKGISYDSLSLVSPQLRQWFPVVRLDDQAKVEEQLHFTNEKAMGTQKRSHTRKCKARKFNTEKYDPDVLTIPDHLDRSG